jgi:hypothetical protein
MKLSTAGLSLAMIEDSGSEGCRLGPDDTEVETGLPPSEDKSSLYVLAATLCAPVDEITFFHKDDTCA